MYKYRYLIFTLMLLVFTGCSKDDPVSAPTGGGGLGGGIGGGGGTTGVIWTIGQTQGTQGGIMFTASPNTAVTVTQLTITLASENFQESFQVDGQTIFQSGTVYEIIEYMGVAPGQQWSFRFVGNTGTAQGAAYDVTSNYTVR
jgi:hypothetical protein